MSERNSLAVRLRAMSISGMLCTLELTPSEAKAIAACLENAEAIAGLKIQEADRIEWLRRMDNLQIAANWINVWVFASVVMGAIAIAAAKLALILWWQL